MMSVIGRPRVRKEKKEIDGKEVELVRDLQDDDILYLQENYVVTDGIFNGTNSNPQEVKALIKAYNDRGIILSVVGFGKDQQAILQMTKMAETGKGSFIPFDNGANARPKLIEEIKSRSHK